MTGMVASGICDLVDEHGREMRARDLVEGWRREADGIANRRSVTREGLEQIAGFFRQAVFQVPEQTKRREASRQQRMTQTLDRDEDGGIKVKTQARNAWHAQPDKKPHKLCPQRPPEMLYNFATIYDITTR